MQTGIIIVAAGRGMRAGGGLAKQWRRVAGKPVARWTLEAFAGRGPLVMVVHPDDISQAQSVAAGLDLRIVTGGADRAASAQGSTP